MPNEHERKMTVTCPACGAKGEASAWQTLNTALEPEAKTALLRGTLFQYKCPSCGAVSLLKYGMLYHDAEHHAMIYSVPENEAAEAMEEIRGAESLNDLTAAAGRKLVKRVVTDPNALREKAAIFDAGLDDRVIELVKLFSGANAVRRDPEIEIEDVFFLADKDGYLLEFISNPPLTARIPQELYDRVQSDFQAQLDAAGNDELVIDRRWAMRLLGLEPQE